MEVVAVKEMLALMRGVKTELVLFSFWHKKGKTFDCLCATWVYEKLRHEKATTFNSQVVALYSPLSVLTCALSI